MDDRLSDLKKGVQIGKRDYGIEESVTGMYMCKIYDHDDFDEDEDTPIEIHNICARCLFMEDDPHNLGDIIEATSYDADCDDCGGDSIISLIMGV